MVGGALGLQSGAFSVLSWLDILAVASLMQVATNCLNEYGDYVHSVDTAPSAGIAGVLVSGELKPKEVLWVAVTCYGMAFLLGILLVLERGAALLALGLAAIVAGVLYSEGPLPVSSTPFGEVLVGAIMGPIEVVSTDIAASGHASVFALAFSVPVALMVTCILLANNLRDVDKDREHGRRTLAVLIGRRRGTELLLGLMVAVSAWSVLALLAFDWPSALLVWIASPVAARTYSQLKAGNSWPRAVPLVARLHIFVGLLLTVSVLVRL